MHYCYRSGKVAFIQWNPPSTGGYSGFKLKVIPLSEPQKSIRNIVIRYAYDEKHPIIQ
jgi:hypothetical protein